MNSREHDAVVRRSFEQQAGLFTGEDAPFVRARRWPGLSHSRRT